MSDNDHVIGKPTANCESLVGSWICIPGRRPKKSYVHFYTHKYYQKVLASSAWGISHAARSAAHTTNSNMQGLDNDSYSCSTEAATVKHNNTSPQSILEIPMAVCMLFAAAKGVLS